MRQGGWRPRKEFGRWRVGCEGGLRIRVRAREVGAVRENKKV